MSETRIVVPDGMLKACRELFVGDESCGIMILKAALLWQRENAPVPTHEQWEEISSKAPLASTRMPYDWVIKTWIRRMYDAPVIPTIEWYIENEWQEGDGLPGPSYRRKYGVEPHANCAHAPEPEADATHYDTPFGRIVIDARVPPGEIRLESCNGPTLIKNIATPEPEVLDFTSRTGTRYRLTIKDGVVMSIGPWSASETDPDMPLVGQVWPPRYAHPEVPPEIADLYEEAPPGGSAQKAILEAYRRGQKAGQ